jgi:hypothetical protein
VRKIERKKSVVVVKKKKKNFLFFFGISSIFLLEAGKAYKINLLLKKEDRRDEKKDPHQVGLLAFPLKLFNLLQALQK